MTDEEGIRRTLAEYCHCLDDARVDDFVKLWTEDGVFTSLSVSSRGRPAIAQWGARLTTEETRRAERKHLTFNSVIDLDGESAGVVSDFISIWKTPRGAVIARAGRYHDRLVKDGDRWRFAERTVIASTWSPPDDQSASPGDQKAPAP